MVGTKGFEMPNTCNDCRYCIPYCIHTAKSDNNDYYCKALDRFMKYDKVDGGVDILGKPSDCPLIEAIPRDQYEARLKVDMINMLTELVKEINPIKECEQQIYGKDSWNFVGKCQDTIQQKINKLKENKDGVEW